MMTTEGAGDTPQETSGTLPTVAEFLDELDVKIGRERPCPMCGGTIWANLTQPLALLGGYLDPDTGVDRAASVLVAAMMCRRCRFVRTHLMSPVLPEADG